MSLPLWEFDIEKPKCGTRTKHQTSYWIDVHLLLRWPSEHSELSRSLRRPPPNPFDTQCAFMCVDSDFQCQSIYSFSVGSSVVVNSIGDLCMAYECPRHIWVMDVCTSSSELLLGLTIINAVSGFTRRPSRLETQPQPKLPHNRPGSLLFDLDDLVKSFS